jgi:colanic acid biosynthesis glycosyl transferase WcaI
MIASSQALAIEMYNSVGGSGFLRRLSQEWERAGAGFLVHQAISESAYRTRRGPLGRMDLRWRMYAGQAGLCWRAARRRPARPTVRVVTTNPFFAPALVARAGRGRAATVNWLFDLFPEALVQAGKIAPGSWAARSCAALTRYALRNCSATVFLGERLRAYAENAHGPAKRSAVIAVGADGSPFADSPPQPTAPGLPPRILYSGLMGSMHDTATLAAAWSERQFRQLDWVFHAGGEGYARLKRSSATPSRAVWGEPLPEPAWQRTMLEAQVALVTIAPGAERVVMPSKTYSALVAGQAVLAICPRGSDLADLVARHDCGWVVEPGDVAGLRSALERIGRAPGEVLEKRRNAFAAGHRFYDVGQLLPAWLRLFAELACAEEKQAAHWNSRDLKTGMI